MNAAVGKMNEYEQMIQNAWNDFSRQNRALVPNILILGATGSGKSSLINEVFGDEVAPVNDTSRGTDDFKQYRNPNTGLNLIDSRGYEMETEDKTKESFDRYEKSIKYRMEKNKHESPGGRIHVVWYCISVAAGRIQPYDIKTLRMLVNDAQLRGRIAVVFTKCDEDDENGSTAEKFRTILAHDVPESLETFEVSTDDSLLDVLDLQKLIEWSANQLDTRDSDEAALDLKEIFIASQTHDLDLKRQAAQKRIAAYAVSAAAIGATPIPFSDAALLTPLQVTMATHVIRIYGLGSFTSISSALLGDVVVSNLGKSLAGGLLKLIPGVGSIAGGAINGGVASLITYAIGYGVSTLCYEACKKLMRGEKVDWSEAFDPANFKRLVNDYMKTHRRGE